MAQVKKSTKTLTRPELLTIAAEAYVDPRSVQHELDYQQGKRKNQVRGLSGERVRAALAARGFGG